MDIEKLRKTEFILVFKKEQKFEVASKCLVRVCACVHARACTRACVRVFWFDTQQGHGLPVNDNNRLLSFILTGSFACIRQLM